MRIIPLVLILALGGIVAAQQPVANPRQQPGAAITMFAPEQHDLYDGQYILSDLHGWRPQRSGGMGPPRQ